MIWTNVPHAGRLKDLYHAIQNAGDYYHVLGIGKSASADEIKMAYGTPARKFHPDVNKNDSTAEAKFKEVQEAYDVLSDTKKRESYDQFGHAGVDSAAAAEAAARAAGAGRGTGGFRYSTQTPGGGGTVDFGEVDLNDLFLKTSWAAGEGGAGVGRRGSWDGIARAAVGEVEGGGGRPVWRGMARRGATVRPQAAAGDDITYPVNISFEQAIRGTTVEVRLNSPDRSIDETISVKIPPGVDEGAKVRVRGKGQPAAAGRGDLIIHVHVEPHAYFRREGKDILLDLPLSMAEAVNGVTVSVPTIDGRVELKIPAGIQSGKRLRIKEKGVTQRDGSRGDQYCRILVLLPTGLSDDEKKQLADIEKQHPFNPRQDTGW